MTVLLFKDRGWEVATAAWSVGSKGDTTVTLIYTWGGDGVGAFASSVPTAKIRLPLTFEAFVARIAASPGICDLRDCR